MMGLLDLLGQIPSLFGSSLAGEGNVPMPRPRPGSLPQEGQPQNFGPSPQIGPPQIGPLGFPQRIPEAIGGAIYGGSPIGSVVNAAKTLFGGELTNPSSIQQNNMRIMYQNLRALGYDHNQALLSIMNPKVAEEAGKAAVNPSNTTIGNTLLQNRPGAAPRPVYREPQKPELVDEYDPATGRTNKRYIQPPEPYGGYGVVGPNMIVPGKTPGAAAPGGVVSAPSAAEKTEGEGTGKIWADMLAGYVNSGISAGKKLQTLSRMGQLSDKAYEGEAAPSVQFLRSALTTFLGPGWQGKVPAGEEFKALANKLTLDANNGSLGSGVSNADVTFIGNINPNMSHTIAGRKEIIATATAIAKREQEVAKMATQWQQKYGTIKGFDTAIAEWAEANPLFAGREQVGSFNNRFTGQGGPDPAQAVAQPGEQGYVARPRTLQDRQKLAPGTRYIAPDGSERVRGQD
jgi:hypothetical protein